MTRSTASSPDPKPGSAPVRSEINVTPLVDVCLVLLIIFMVVTPMIGNGGKAQLPETSRPAAMPEEREALTVTVTADGQLWVGENQVPAAELASRLESEHSQAPERPMWVKGDRNLPYEQVRKVMRTLNEAGFSGASLITVRRTDAATTGA